MGPLKLFKDVRKNPLCYLLALPALVYTFLFGYMTLPYIYIAFTNFHIGRGLWRSEFVGLSNFAFFFGSPRAWQITYNTLAINVFSLFLGTALSVILAIMLNEVSRVLFKKVSQSILIFPHFLSWVVVSYIVFAIFSTERGFANNALSFFGFETIGWYAQAEYWRPILIIVRIWKFVGINTVIFLAAITGIDGGLYEAARVDGAGKWKQTRHITLPLMMPTVCILTLLGIGRIFFGDFQMVYTIIRDNGILLPRTDVIDTFVYRALRTTADPSAAMAVGLYQAVVGFILVLTVNLVVRKKFPEGSLF